MLLRRLPRIRLSVGPPTLYGTRNYYIPSKTISDPPAYPAAATSISLAHPKDPGSSSQPTTSSPSPSSNSPPSFQEPEDQYSVDSHPPVPINPTFEHSNDPPQSQTTLPSPHHALHPSTYAHPPFDTHQFFAALEKTFPTPTARSLMRATRALLVNRIGRVRREALTVKDLESVSRLSSRICPNYSLSV